MPTTILATKLYIPPPRPKAVLRPRLIKQMHEALPHKLTLISAPAGFGKTTLVSAWIAGGDRSVAWLSLDEGDSDPTRFLTYLVAAVQTLALSADKGGVSTIGAGVLAALQSPQPPPTAAILTALLNELATIPEDFTLVLDDYHVLDSEAVDNALVFLLEHLPPQMHLVITTREDPPLPLARYRVRGQLTELRATDLRFTPAEAADFLNQVMGLTLTAEEIAALETRTEGWIAGLQLAAVSMQGHQDTAGFIKSFTGSHRFVLDYLAEEVLHQQPASVQTFLLRTSILDRLCAPLCDAVLLDPAVSGQETLTYLEQANLFIVPLDNERRWYRYHRLFADLLRQRLHQWVASSMWDEGKGSEDSPTALHTRASQWYEDNDLDIEAFHHATAANDFARAAHLVEGEGMPLIFRGAAVPVLAWLESLPVKALDERPSLWVIYASSLLFASQMSRVEEKLKAAEAALYGVEPDDGIRDLIGHIASIRATLGVLMQDAETIVFQSQRALEYLAPENLPVRTATTWTLGVAYQLRGERAAARQAFSTAIAASQAIGHFIIHLMSTIGLGQVQESENQLDLAAETYRRAIQLAGDPPQSVVCEAHFGLASILYEWDDLDAARTHGQESIRLARQAAYTDRLAAYESLLTRLDEKQEVNAAPTSPLTPRPSTLIEPLSERELEVLQLVAQGLSNREISERLFLALSTVKGHNRNIFGKLQVQRRTEAVARARELGLVSV